MTVKDASREGHENIVPSLIASHIYADNLVRADATRRIVSGRLTVCAACKRIAPLSKLLYSSIVFTFLIIPSARQKLAGTLVRSYQLRISAD